MGAVLSSADVSAQRYLDAKEGNPETLIAELVAALYAGDRELEREARRALKSQFGMKLQFANELESPKELSE